MGQLALAARLLHLLLFALEHGADIVLGVFQTKLLEEILNIACAYKSNGQLVK